MNGGDPCRLSEEDRPVVMPEEGAKAGGVGAEIAAGLAERCPGVRIERVARFTPVLENAYGPTQHASVSPRGGSSQAQQVLIDALDHVDERLDALAAMEAAKDLSMRAAMRSHSR